MSIDTFSKLIPSLKRTKLVYLQGWGEPLLNPGFFKMVRIARDAGCRVGTTTNGMLIDDDMIAEIFISELDIITFSLAGGLRTNNKIRVGTDINHIKEQIQKLGTIRNKQNLSKPEIHIAYMMTKSNFIETENILKQLDGLPFDSLVISTLDFTACKAIAHEEIYPANGDEYKSIKSMLEKVQDEGRRKDIEVNFYLGSPDQLYQSCTEMPQYTCFISADGSVSPCVFTNLPVSEVDYEQAATTSKYERLVFGNINDKPLAAIWRSPSYREFRNSFEKGELKTPCNECRKMHMIAQ